MTIVMKYCIILIILLCIVALLCIVKGILIVLDDEYVIGIIAILFGIGIFILSCLGGCHYYTVINNDKVKLDYAIKDLAISRQDTFFYNEAEICLNKVEEKGYLTDEIKIQLKQDLTDKNFNLRELKIDGSSQNDKSNTVYIKITYDGKSYFKSGKKLNVN